MHSSPKRDMWKPLNPSFPARISPLAQKHVPPLQSSCWVSGPSALQVPRPPGHVLSLLFISSFIISSLGGRERGWLCRCIFVRPYSAMCTYLIIHKTLSISPGALSRAPDWSLDHAFVRPFTSSCVSSFNKYLLPWGYRSTKTTTASVPRKLLISCGRQQTSK